MLTSPRLALLAASFLVLESCAATTAVDARVQALVVAAAGRNSDVLRLTIHAIPTGESHYKAIASTLASKIGAPSDPEDLQAIQNGETVVLDKLGGIDVTVPIRLQNGRHTAAAGVTMKSSMGRDAAIRAAKAIAAAIDLDMIPR